MIHAILFLHSAIRWWAFRQNEGLEVTSWPVATVLRGQVAMRDGRVQAQPGSGRYLARGPYDMIRPRGVLANDFDASVFA